jgi:hypothetical protein
MLQQVKYPSVDGPEYVTNMRGYRWFEVTLLSRWEAGGKCQILCIDAPPDLPMELQKVLAGRPAPLDFRDPFAMHTDLWDQIIVYYDIALWRVRDLVRELKVSRRSSSTRR